MMNAGEYKAKVIFIGPVPPPYMGPTLATEILLRSRLAREYRLLHLDNSDHREMDKLGAVDFWNIVLPLWSYVVLLWMLIRHRPQAVYVPISQTTLGYLKDSVYIIIAKLFGRRVISHLRGGYFRQWLQSASALTRWYVKRVHGLVDAQIVLGDSLRNMFEGILPAERIYVVPNGRNFPDMSKRQALGARLRVLFFGNFNRSKGVLDVLHAVPQVVASFPAIEFVFAGEWTESDTRAEIEAFVDKNPSLPVRVLGRISGQNKLEVLANSDIFVFPTYYPFEGHPWVIVEAMAAGLPVISTDHAAISESVCHGKTGFLVAKQSPQAIAEKVLLLAGDERLRASMGQAGRQRYEQHFTEESMSERMVNVFDAVLLPRDVVVQGTPHISPTPDAGGEA